MQTEHFYKTYEDKLIPVFVSETIPPYYYVYEFIGPSEGITERRPTVITTAMFHQLSDSEK